MFDFAAASVPLTISFGDSAESMDMVLDIARDAGAMIEVEVIASGQDIYRREIKEGIMPESLDAVRRSKLFLKAPTKTPKEEGYISVMQAFCNKYDVHTRLEYYVCEEAPGVGLVVESEGNHINAEDVAEIFRASQKLGGRKFAYTVSDLRLVFEKELKDYPNFNADSKNLEELKTGFANYDVIFASEEDAKELRKAMKVKYGCQIFLGNGHAFFEPLDDYNKSDRGLLLATALVLKYAGQDNEAWSVYEKLAA